MAPSAGDVGGPRRGQERKVSTTPPSIDEAAFRAALGSFATGVGVMTTEVDGVWHGMTANAVSSVSLEPPLVLVCVARSAAMAGHVVDGGVFALSFLAAPQSGYSNRFADSSTTSEEKFAGVAARPEVTGAPVLDGAVGWVDCRVWSVADGGDHIIAIGEVVAAGARPQAAPLVYFRGAYGGFGTAS